MLFSPALQTQARRQKNSQPTMEWTASGRKHPQFKSSFQTADSTHSAERTSIRNDAEPLRKSAEWHFSGTSVSAAVWVQDQLFWDGLIIVILTSRDSHCRTERWWPRKKKKKSKRRLLKGDVPVNHMKKQEDRVGGSMGGQPVETPSVAQSGFVLLHLHLSLLL